MDNLNYSNFFNTHNSSVQRRILFSIKLYLLMGFRSHPHTPTSPPITTNYHWTLTNGLQWWCFVAYNTAKNWVPNHLLSLFSRIINLRINVQHVGTDLISQSPLSFTCAERLLVPQGETVGLSNLAGQCWCLCSRKVGLWAPLPECGRACDALPNRLWWKGGCGALRSGPERPAASHPFSGTLALGALRCIQKA